MTAVDVSNGAEQWAAAPGGILGTTPPIVGGAAYVGHESGLYALDVSSGGLEWGLDNRGPICRP